MWCKKSKALLDEKKVQYNPIFVNELEGDEKEKVRSRVRELNPAMSFPTLKIGETIIIGHHPEKIEEAIAKCQPMMQ
jgi:glutaredoxin